MRLILSAQAPHPTTPYPKMTEGWHQKHLPMPNDTPGLAIAELPGSRLHDDRFRRILSMDELLPPAHVLHDEPIGQPMHKLHNDLSKDVMPIGHARDSGPPECR